MRPRWCAFAVVALAAGLAACSIGVSQQRLTGDLGPGGARIAVVLRSGARFSEPLGVRSLRLEGELVEVRVGSGVDDLLLLRPAAASSPSSRALLRISTRAISRVETLSPAVDGLDGDATPQLLERLRPVSRHPQGLSAEMTETLLRSVGQERLVEVTH